MTMKKQNIMCLIGRAVAIKLTEGDGMGKRQWDWLWHGAGYGSALGWLHGCLAAQGVCGQRAAAQCCWGHRKVCLASSGTSAFISTCQNPCALPACPVPQVSATVQETLWPVDCGGCCADLALSEKEILIIYVQFVWFLDWLSYWYYLCC